MNRSMLLYLTVCLICIHGLNATQARDPYNPKPEDSDLVLPMPGDAIMVFRSVFLGIGDSPFAMREYKVGDRAGGGFKEYPTTVYISGAFQDDNKGKKDWLFYLGKYEVTEQQYNAVLKGAPEGKADPVVNISWFDAKDFIHKYNTWLLENARDKLPTNEDMPGFLRMPTELEWEFAARGGDAVKQAVFDKKEPYEAVLTKHEWFSGPTSSHDKIKKIGLLNPNPLGLYDMLGNVSEMTESFYRVEYYQGRFGGFVSRGGSFRTPSKMIRSSLRYEQPFYKVDGQTTKQDSMGFRLLISSPIFVSRNTSQTLEDAWTVYRQVRPTPMSAAASTGPTSVQTGLQIEDARRSLDRLEKELEHMPNVTEAAKNSLGLLKASFGDIEALIKKAEQDSADVFSRIASFTAMFFQREMKKVPRSLRIIEISENLKDTAGLARQKEIHATILKNIEDAVDRYGDCMKQLDKFSMDAVKSGFKKYEQYLIGKGQAEQIKVNRLVMKHFEEYNRSKRLNMDTWKKELGEP